MLRQHSSVWPGKWLNLKSVISLYVHDDLARIVSANDTLKIIHPIPGSTRVEGVKEALGSLQIKLSESEIEEIRKVIASAGMGTKSFYIDTRLSYIYHV